VRLTGPVPCRRRNSPRGGRRGKNHVNHVLSDALQSVAGTALGSLILAVFRHRGGGPRYHVGTGLSWLGGALILSQSLLRTCLWAGGRLRRALASAIAIAPRAIVTRRSDSRSLGGGFQYRGV